MPIYHYHPDTGELLGEEEVTIIHDEKIIPAYATETVPPSAKAGFVAVFDEQQTQWTSVKDLRGTRIWNVNTKEESIVDYLGKLQKEHTSKEPKEFDEWNGSKWVENSQEKQKRHSEEIIQEAKSLLLNTDYWALQDTDDMTLEEKEYREKLREIIRKARKDDLTPQTVVWPKTTARMRSTS